MGVKTSTPDSLQDRTRYVKSPTLGMSPRSPLSPRDMRGPDPTRSARSPEPATNLKSPEPQRDLRSPESTRSAITPISPTWSATKDFQNKKEKNTVKNPLQAMAQTSETQIPTRSESRRRSLMEKTQGLLRRRPSFQADGENSKSGVNLPIQSPSSHGSPSKGPSSPSLLRRLSSRKGHSHSISMSTYSTSPTADIHPSNDPVIRESSPAHTRNDGEQVPTQSSYGTLSLLPPHKAISPLQTPFLPDFSSSDAPPVPSLPSPKGSPHDSEGKLKPPTPTIVPAIKPTAILDDSEGNVNTSHPLLREARHTRFAVNNNNNNNNNKGAPGSHTPTDPPLRSYSSQPTFAQSNPDLSQREAQPMRPPKRTSSLSYNSSGISDAMLKNRIVDVTIRSPTPTQGARDTANSKHLARATTAPVEDDLGVHPAHRSPEPSFDPMATPSPAPSASQSAMSDHDAIGSTPPPIATARSPSSERSTVKPSSRFVPPAPRLDTENHPPADNSTSQTNSATSASSFSPPMTGPGGKFATSSTEQAPFYLNPASPTALVDFLATTPPLSSAQQGSRTEPATPQTQPTSTFFNRTFLTSKGSRPEDPASPPPPGPGTHSSRSTTAVDKTATTKTGPGARFHALAQRAMTTGSSTNLRRDFSERKVLSFGKGVGNADKGEDSANTSGSGNGHGWKKVFTSVGSNRSKNNLPFASVGGGGGTKREKKNLTAEPSAYNGSASSNNNGGKSGPFSGKGITLNGFALPSKGGRSKASPNGGGDGGAGGTGGSVTFESRNPRLGAQHNDAASPGGYSNGGDAGPATDGVFGAGSGSGSAVRFSPAAVGVGGAAAAAAGGGGGGGGGGSPAGYYTSTPGNNTNGANEDEITPVGGAAGFMGVGKDGVWISRKNFVRS